MTNHDLFWNLAVWSLKHPLYPRRIKMSTENCKCHNVSPELSPVIITLEMWRIPISRWPIQYPIPSVRLFFFLSYTIFKRLANIFCRIRARYELEKKKKRKWKHTSKLKMDPSAIMGYRPTKESERKAPTTGKKLEAAFHVLRILFPVTISILYSFLMYNIMFDVSPTLPSLSIDSFTAVTHF